MLWQTSLSVTMGVGGWGWPRNSRVVRRGHPSCPAWKAAATSASYEAETTGLIMLETTRIGPLFGGLAVGGVLSG